MREEHRQCSDSRLWPELTGLKVRGSLFSCLTRRTLMALDSIAFDPSQPTATVTASKEELKATDDQCSAEIGAKTIRRCQAIAQARKLDACPFPLSLDVAQGG